MTDFPERVQLRRLDLALLALVEERARIRAALPAGDPSRRAAVADLLRRHRGDLSPESVERLFRLLDAACDAAEEGVA